MNDLHVLVIGAGPAGLTTALALARLGIRVSVYEQAPRLGDVGAGFTIAANGSVVLYELGLGPVLDEWAVIPNRGAVKHYLTGAELVDIPRGTTQLRKYGAPYCQVHRADLHAGLVRAVSNAAPGAVHLGCSLRDFSQDAGSVTARFADGSTATGDLLVGCDGIRSTVRAQLFGDDQPRFTGYVAWRGLVPMERLPRRLIEPDSAIWVGPGHFLTRYKVRCGELLNYVAIARTQAWAEEGWSVKSTVDAVLAEFQEFDPAARTILAATPPESCYRWGIFDREPLPAWSRARVTLLGDAAHPMTPFLGQGAVMALEDAMILARVLVASSSLPEALERYERARVERTARVLVESARNGEQLTAMSPGDYAAEGHRNEETLGLASYNAVTCPV